MENYSTVNDLYNYVRKFCLHDSLAYIGSIGYKIFHEDQSSRESLYSLINEWQLTFIAKSLILNSNDHRKETFDKDALIKTLNICNNIFDDKLKIAAKDDKIPNNIEMHSFFIRTAFQQFPFQVGTRNKIPRALFLFEDIPNEIKNPIIDLKKEIKEIYDLNIIEILTIGISIFTRCGNGYFNPDHIINVQSNYLKKFLTSDKVNKLISKFSIDYDSLREEFKKYSGPLGLEQYEFNPLKVYPIVKTQIAGLVIPVPIFLIYRITDGLFYDLSEKFKKEKSNPFHIFFGKEIFERYVGILLKQKYNSSELFSEWSYGTKKNKHNTVDWIVIRGNNAILIECKTSGISQEAKSFTELEILQQDLGLRIVKSIKQISQLVKDIRNRVIGLEKLFNIKRFYFIVITFDRVFLSGTPFFKDLISQELEKENIKIKNYQILSIDELENLIPVLHKYELEFLLDKKFENPYWSTYDFEIFLKEFFKEKKININTVNPLLKERYESFMKTVNPHFKLSRDNI